MKATKKIIPALVMLLVSAVLLSTASYAWFSMNTTVTATGMQVTVKAPTSLLISNTSATTGFGSTVNLSNDIKDALLTFAPVAYAGVPSVGEYAEDETDDNKLKTSTNSWYKLTTVGMAHINENGRASGFTEVADGEAELSFTGTMIGEDAVYETANTMVYHDQVWLKVEGEKDQTVTVAAAYTSTVADEIKSAMHIVFVVGGLVVDTLDMGGVGVKTTSGTLMTLEANDEDGGTLVDIYYFLSGNDADCMNIKISQNDTMSIDLTFNATDVVVGG